MTDNQIHFNLHGGKVKISMQHPVSFTEFIALTCSGILNAMKAIENSVPQEQKAQVKEELYDMFNASASNTLQYFAPEIEMRPHLTSQAIMKAEDDIINAVVKKKKEEAK